MAGSRELLSRLARARNRYGPGAAAAKLELMGALARVPLGRPRELVALHSHLLFLKAFPDDAAVRRAAEQGLAAFAARMRRLSARRRTALDDTGLARTTSRHTFEGSIARWLAARYPDHAEIDWRQVSDSSGIDLLLGLVAERAEQDALESPQLATRAWLRRAKAGAPGSDLAWLLGRLTRHPATRASWRALYDHVGVPVVWRLGDGAATMTHNSLPGAALRYRRGLRSLPPRPKRLIATPLRRIELLDRSRAAAVIDTTRAALTARCREVYAVSHANPAEVYLADLGEGASLALIGVLPERRLSLESNYGYLLLANGVPIGYGGVTPLYRQANTGINVFEAFRGSEAALLWAQALRAFRTLFGVSRFVVNPYQFGAGNHEAIASGAFWFYYRLGFRPRAPELAALAAAECRRQRASPRYRTRAATLRRLATGDLELVLPGARARDRFAEDWLPDLSLLASGVLTRAAADGWAVAAERTAARVARLLGIRALAHWTAAEREALRALAPLVALLDLDAVGARGRAELVRLVRAKGAAREAPYVRAAARDPNLLPSLLAIARRAARRRDGIA